MWRGICAESSQSFNLTDGNQIGDLGKYFRYKEHIARKDRELLYYYSWNRSSEAPMTVIIASPWSKSRFASLPPVPFSLFPSRNKICRKRLFGKPQFGKELYL
jgi:hypothetical protein